MQGNLNEIDIRSILQLILGQRTIKLFVEAYSGSYITESFARSIQAQNYTVFRLCQLALGLSFSSMVKLYMLPIAIPTCFACATTCGAIKLVTLLTICNFPGLKPITFRSIPICGRY